MDEQLQFIKTIHELNRHKGEIIVCYYYWGGKKDKPYFMWMGKYMGLQWPEDYYGRESIEGVRLMMENQITIGDCYGFDRKVPYELSGNGCDAQSYIRIPTEEELKTYMYFQRHKRIFGK